MKSVPVSSNLLILVLTAAHWCCPNAIFAAESSQTVDAGAILAIPGAALLEVNKRFFAADQAGKEMWERIQSLKDDNNSVLRGYLSPLPRNIAQKDLDKEIDNFIELSKDLNLVMPPIFSYYKSRSAGGETPIEVTILIDRMSRVVLEKWEKNIEYSKISSGK